MHCSDFVFIICTIRKGKMALGTSVEAATEKYSAKVGLGAPVISKMELFVTLYDCHKELHHRCCKTLPLESKERKVRGVREGVENFPILVC